MAARHYFITGLLLLAGWATALAQTVVSVHGTVIHANGDPQEGIEIWVTGYAAGDSSVFFTSAFTGPDGAYSTFLTFPDPNALGTVEVSMVDCFGLIQSQFFPIGNGITDVQADFTYCDGVQVDSCLVWIIEEGTPPFFVQLTAYTPFGGNAEFLWNTGETSQTITPQVSGTYCVTATLPTGCDTMACTDVVVDSIGGCFAYIVSSPNNDGTYNLEAVGLGVPPLTYLWDNGISGTTLDSVGPGTYCVVVTDSLGCAYTTCMIVDDFEFCEAFIQEDPAGGLTAIGFGQEPFTYSWSNGSIAQTIFPSQPGLYCVTVTDAAGCEAPTCIETGGGFDSCYVYIVPYYIDSLTLGLEAVASSVVGIASYLWSTGDTNSVITPVDLSQTYCVTVTDAQGCVATSCFDPSNFCYAWVDIVYVDSSQAVLTVYTDPIFNFPGNPIPEYLWSNGETGQSITVDTSGSYCVSVALAAGCTVESCAEVDFESLGAECYAWINQYPDSTTGLWVAEVQTWGWGTFTYAWNTGDTTSQIILQPGDFACVTATSSFGCTAEACTDTISPCQPIISQTYLGPYNVELMAYLWSDPAQTGQYIWNTGDTTTVLTVTEEGTYCVTVTAFGCIGEACIEVFFHAADSCGVTIVAEPNPLGVLYSAEAWGVPPFSYAWSNGSTEASFIVDFGPLDYCLTVTDALGCVATDCYSTFDSCYISLVYDGQAGNIIYAQTSDPFAPIVWSTGDTLTSWIVIDAPGTYCATVFTLWGCTATNCITVDSLYFHNDNVISGFVFTDSAANIAGRVHAYRLVDNTPDQYERVATADIDPQGFYQLPNLTNGLYILKAEAMPGTPDAEIYIPTYHLNSASWVDARPHILPNFLPVTTDIWMIRNTNPTGGGVIGGSLFDPEGLLAGVDLDLRGAGDLGGIVVLLKDVDGLPLQYVYSEPDGAFRFDNLPYGTYRLSYDLPGFQSPDIWVTISPDEPEKLGVNLPISGITAVDDVRPEEIAVYPNPARDQLYIPVPDADGEYTLRMTDIQGRTVFSGSVLPQAGIIRMNVSDYAPGLYQVQVFGRLAQYHGRWIRQD